MIRGGIEAGGTKWVCAVADGDGRLLDRETLTTTTPAETLRRAGDFLARHGELEAVGVGAFGPLDLRDSSPTFGSITTTPKPGWAYTDIVTPLRERLGVPVVLDTDVNAAALGEWRWGRGVGVDALCYVTVGTGIGAGVIVDGHLLHGAWHPEIGHIRVPRDRDRDPFPGSCPFHGDCLEGLASGEALRQRWGRPAEELDDDPAIWDLEADYLALGLLNAILTLAPGRVVLGGGVASRDGLLARVRVRLRELIGGYLDVPALASVAALDDYLVAPGLGDRSGVLGALELARLAGAGLDAAGQIATAGSP